MCRNCLVDQLPRCGLPRGAVSARLAARLLDDRRMLAVVAKATQRSPAPIRVQVQ